MATLLLIRDIQNRTRRIARGSDPDAPEASRSGNSQTGIGARSGLGAVSGLSELSVVGEPSARKVGRCRLTPD